ncbi:HAD family hydrolase [Paraoerskovia marina]|uniref:Haloacid dehalogenase superfamily, subfamily IA, variant 3 with third motif having DD or ED n=1 Tax=Paraoerskovia marina TaxID=545619 RepID=A0A1H1NLI1_9CELL|nr:HAD-IA family hydrolase [Paraoerskovia marina]SDR99818.1 haloacid dehalogenase superfamily, subfamily IA, variant 3 with third motif having DD or ED [Paraoerskovia marina]
MAQLSVVLFDLDGVLTPTAEVHRRAWARLFDAFTEENGLPPYSDADYFALIDGKPRFEGVADFVADRGVELPWGSPDDEPGDSTVCALGNKKNVVVNQLFESEGVSPYPGSVAFLDAVVAAGAHVAVVSSSRNAPAVLRAAGLDHYFETVVDGTVAAAEGLPGKPAPDTYVYAARLFGVTPEQAVVVEDAISGVQSGRAGEFGLVVGVDRGVGADALRSAGADVVVADLDELDASVLEGGR